ncbi:MAG: type II secretion system F family protein [Chloroflexota bacterium]|nr:type II secretion system F family protein [Chloroflexota bacterium]MDE3101354.1 type II secretion system F family protein [Chloroflexota bacterium]
MSVALAIAAVAVGATAIDPRSLWSIIGRLAGRRRLRRDARASRAALPALVASLGSALSGGLSLQQAFAETAPALPASLAVPTRQVAASLALGVPLADAIVAYRGVVPDEDVAPLAIVLASFVRAGGRVRRSLARVESLLRGRLALEEEQAALTAQGRASAFVLVLLAPLGGIFFAISMPDYVPILLQRGRALLAVAVLLEIVAAVWLRHLLRVPRTGSALASLLDAVVVGLDSGMTFEQALRALVDRAPAVGRLTEARHLLADLALAQGGRRAFASFGAAGAAEARVAALISSSVRFGAPLADLLVLQADALRESDRRRAEAAARRLPVLLLFPLTFCVLPALLIVFLGPPLLSVVS